MSPILDSIGSVKAFGWGAFVAGGSYESIASTTVGSGGSSTITFSSISADYTHLQLRFIARGNGSSYQYISIRYNSDSGNNYADHFLQGDGSSASAGQVSGSSATRFDLSNATGSATSTFGAGIIDILDYKNGNKYKTTRGLTGIDQNGSGGIALGSGLWMSTSAITTIVIQVRGGTESFTQYSEFSLYGIRGS